MITRTTLKALWIGGGGILATWLAVSPNQGGPAAAPEPGSAPAAAVRTPGAEELGAQADQLRDRTREVALRPSTRNPFRYGSRKSTTSTTARADREVAPAMAPDLSAAPPPPPLVLSGVAQSGGIRTAVISGAGQIYVVGEGGAVAGRYTVVTIDPEAVLLRDADGDELRLILPQ